MYSGFAAVAAVNLVIAAFVMHAFFGEFTLLLPFHSRSGAAAARMSPAPSTHHTATRPSGEGDGDSDEEGKGEEGRNGKLRGGKKEAEKKG